MNKKQYDVFNSLKENYIKENENYLKKDVAKRNKQTKEGLLNSIDSSYDDLKNYEDDVKSMSLSKFKKKLNWYMRRSVFYYINKPLIYKVAKKFKNLELQEEDILAASKTGFIIALNEFDPSKGFQFSTYAWKIMSNEIIAANKKRLRTTSVKQASIDIFIYDNGVVSKIEDSNTNRSIMVKGEKVFPKNVTVKFSNGAEKVYEYVYNLPKKIKVGTLVKSGEIIGNTSGVETDITSMDWMNDNDEHGDVVFNNPLTSKRNEDIRPDSEVNREFILDAIYSAIDKLSKAEQLIITKRFLSQKKVNRADVSKQLQITEYAASKLEKEALVKLKNILLELGIDNEDKLFS